MNKMLMALIMSMMLYSAGCTGVTASSVTYFNTNYAIDIDGTINRTAIGALPEGIKTTSLNHSLKTYINDVLADSNYTRTGDAHSVTIAYTVHKISYNKSILPGYSLNYTIKVLDSKTNAVLASEDRESNGSMLADLLHDVSADMINFVIFNVPGGTGKNTMAALQTSVSPQPPPP